MSDDESHERRRSTRSRAKSSKNQDALEKIKELRKTGKSNRIDVNEYAPELYQEIDEEEYAQKYGGFVEDDDGNGYVDNGQDDDEEAFTEVNEKEKKKKDRRAGKVKKGALDSFFSAVLPNQKESEPVSTRDINDDLNAMLHDIANDDNILEDITRPLQREEENLNPFSKKRALSIETHSTFSPPMKLPRRQIKLTTSSRNKPIKKVEKVLSPPKPAHFDDDDDYDYGTNDFDAPSPPRRTQPPNNEDASLSKRFDKELSFEEKEPPKTPDTPKISRGFAETSQKHDLSQINFNESKMDFFEEDVDDSPAPVVSTDSNISKTGYFLESKSLRFYWFDAYEDSKHPGKVYLFGFVKRSDNDEFESCCVILEKILYRIYFMAREDHQETGEPVTPKMLYDEVTALLTNHYKIEKFKSKASSKKFAFMDGETPEEAMCLDVSYDPTCPTMPPGPYNGKCFNRIANATVTAMERLLIERDIQGPCWLEISGINEVVQVGEKISYCQREFKAVVSKVELDLVNVLTNMKDQLLPKCKMMALNIITVANPKTNKSEIVLISMLRSSRYFLDRRTQTNWEQRKTFICPPPGATLPFQFQQEAEKAKIDAEKCPNEKSMLQKFLGAMKMFDPDVVVGHDLASQMSILRDRLEENKLINVNWTFMGRLKRHESLKHAPQNKHFRWSWTAGRLYLDSKAAATELVHSQSYDLDELVSKVLNSKERPDVDSEKIARIFYENNGKTDLIFKLIKWSLGDAQYSHLILTQLNAMQLFLQITRIAGGVLSRTLLGGRAERNEYLLLHAFFRSGFIAPDRILAKPKAPKASKQEKAAATTQKTDNDEAPPTSKKAQYTGGLVLEPKKGLYETFIVLLDFNSLYPSIIQEFNICFTTVKVNQEKEADESDLPSIPDSSLPPGILPKEMAKLVHSRREVKNQMANISDKNSPTYKQCEILQLAFKLTANSMYGCLGFEGSRFCAKTLAAMITAKGREILESTRNIVENNGFAVIYGDTDSIMVNTNSINLDETRKIGQDIKRLINKSYKQLTLDIDGVYKKLLLLKKKKYAGLAIDLSNEQRISKELKGLDIVRRDWSFLAKETGEKVVDIILTSNGRDEMVEDIRQTLALVKEGIEQQQIPLEKFEILKKLTHRPEDYRDSKSQPHVLVALRLNQTKNANLRQNDIVKYIICDDQSGQAATQRAYARIEIENNNNLKIDSNYYLAHQIHPVVSRLCEPIEELDACQIAEALGLDGTHFRRKLIEQCDDAENDENGGPGILFNFNACEGLSIECPKCQNLSIHRSTVTEDNKPSLAECPSCSFDFLSDPSAIELQIIQHLHSAFKKYSQSKYTCEDEACNFELNLTPEFKTKHGIPCTKCSHSFLKRNYTLKKLFDQQIFVSKILDFNEWKTKEATKEQQEAIKSYCKLVVYEDASATWLKRVKKILAENPYNRIDLSSVFAPMRIL